MGEKAREKGNPSLKYEYGPVPSPHSPLPLLREGVYGSNCHPRNYDEIFIIDVINIKKIIINVNKRV